MKGAKLMNNSPKQLALFDTFNYLQDFENNDKVKLINLLNENIDFHSLIPSSLHSKYNNCKGRNPFMLSSMVKAFFIKNIFGYSKVSMLIDALSLSPELRKFCGFSKIPHKSKFSRFRKLYCNEFENMFNSLVNITEPICRKMGENFASHIIYDTSGINPYVSENNSRFFNNHLKKVKKQNKDKSKEDIFKIAYATMPKQAEANNDIKLMYVNGSFNYAYKFGLFTNAFGIVRHIAFVDKDFTAKHAELKDSSYSDSPDDDKTIGDSTLLKPMLTDFSKIIDPKFSFHTFLADSALDKYEHFPMLMNDFDFKRVLIPINKRNSSADSPDNGIHYNQNGTPICSKYNLTFKNGGISKEANRSTRHKFNCPKTKSIKGKLTCLCETPCSKNEYGRTIYTYPDQDLRAFPGIDRDSEHFRKVYKRRTVIERTNHFFKNVMGIGDSLMQDSKSFKFDLFSAGITQLVLLLLSDKVSNLKNHHPLSVKAA